jgi:hypothetical protein
MLLHPLLSHQLIDWHQSDPIIHLLLLLLLLVFRDNLAQQSRLHLLPMHLTPGLLSLDNSILNFGALVDEAEGIRSLILLPNSMDSCNGLEFSVKLIIRLHQHEISSSSKLQTSSDESCYADENLNVILLLSETGLFVHGVGEGVEYCDAVSGFHACADEADTVLLVFRQNDSFDKLDLC